jgi:cell fate regulator YaaT (PSP1 superfamily)
MELNQGNYVVLHTEKGQEFGWVVRQPRNLVLAQPEVDSSATVVRKGTASDFRRWQQLKETVDDALKLARSIARELQLTLKIVATHYTFNRSRIIVTFGAEGRVDFRPLLLELGAALRCCVERRQIGDRDVAKLAGGIGRCGRVLCCSEWMTKSLAIGIRMVKEQDPPISADGLAGACGRLRCCLRIEYEQYRQVNRELPRIGKEVRTPNGVPTVIVGHRLKETVSVRYDDDQVLEWPLAELSRSGPSKN